jgi:hypothetical protein
VLEREEERLVAVDGGQVQVRGGVLAEGAGAARDGQPRGAAQPHHALQPLTQRCASYESRAKFRAFFL